MKYHKTSLMRVMNSPGKDPSTRSPTQFSMYQVNQALPEFLLRPSHQPILKDQQLSFLSNPDSERNLILSSCYLTLSQSYHSFSYIQIYIHNLIINISFSSIQTPMGLFSFFNLLQSPLPDLGPERVSSSSSSSYGLCSLSALVLLNRLPRVALFGRTRRFYGTTSSHV